MKGILALSLKLLSVLVKILDTQSNNQKSNIYVNRLNQEPTHKKGLSLGPRVPKSPHYTWDKHTFEINSLKKKHLKSISFTKQTKAISYI